MAFWITIGVCVLIGFAVVIDQSRRRRTARRMLTAWVEGGGLTLVSAHYRWLRRGPFSLIVRGGSIVFRIVADASEGRRVRGWLRCNVDTGGRGARRVYAEWDDAGSGFPVIMKSPDEPE